MAYREEVHALTLWCQENHLSLNISKTKKLEVDCAEGTTTPHFPQAPEEIWNKSPHPPLILHLHCGEHPDRLHHRLVWKWHQQQSQRDVRTAHHTVGGELPSLQDIYTRRCMRKGQRITSHPSHGLFSLLPSGRRLRSIRSRTSWLKDSFSTQTIRLLNTEYQNWHSHNTPLYPYHSP